MAFRWLARRLLNSLRSPMMWSMARRCSSRFRRRRRAMLHIMGDLSEFNKRLANQRKAMLHVLADYEQDRRRLAHQTERLDSSRRALLHIPPGPPPGQPRPQAPPQAHVPHQWGPRGDTA